MKNPSINEPFYQSSSQKPNPVGINGRPHNNTDLNIPEIDSDKLGLYKSCIHVSDLPNIQKKLNDIEKKHNIKIIYACEVGSKARGSDSLDSDYDIRFLYVSPKSQYVEKHNETIKEELNDKFDIYGYDISKFLELIKQQNYSPFEWLHSPIKYYTCDIIKDINKYLNEFDLNELSKSYKRLSIRNYESLLKNKEKEIPVKDYLIVFKTVLLAKYIDNFNEMPPLNWNDLLKADLYDDDDEKIILESLLQTKRTQNRNIEIPQNTVLNNFLKTQIENFSSYDLSKNNISEEKAHKLDDFLISLINSKEFENINRVIPTLTDEKRFSLYPEDNDYRKEILTSMGISPNEYLSIKSIIGNQELQDIVANFQNTPECYVTNVDQNDLNTAANLKNGTFRANLHIHTNYSDGKMNVKKLLDNAAKYADKISKQTSLTNNQLSPFTIAITDHNTMDACKEAVDIIRKNPDKYKNLRVVLGTELSAQETKAGDYTPLKPYQIHLLAYCVNPFDEKVNQILESKKDKKRPFYKSIGSMKEVADIFSSQPNVIFAYAHPLEHLPYKKANDRANLPNIIKSLIDKFKETTKGKAKFVENYYQAYSLQNESSRKLIANVKEYSDHLDLLSTGGLDNHGPSIFYR